MDHGCPSTKNGDGHGLGLENIRAAVERYSGWFGVAWDNGIFTISADLKDE
jgi:sensor histidine kinase regulating citrate/malate metabolism